MGCEPHVAQKIEPFVGPPLLTGMKIMKPTCFSILLAASVMVSGGTEAFRTNINPALQYYQAFLMAPDLEPADRDYLYLDWRGKKLPERFGELMAKYDNEFRLVRQAAHAGVPCDWGIDMSSGPQTLLPQLARGKAVVQAARLRAM